MNRKFREVGRVVLMICERRDRHTDMLIAILCTPIGGRGGRINKKMGLECSSKVV